MDKRKLVKIINGIMGPFGFVKRTNSWILVGEEVVKVVYLQKSNFSNRYYLNYGFILKNIELDGFNMHIENQLSSTNDLENESIMNLLNLEKDISEVNRRSELSGFINKYIIKELMMINSESELRSELMNRDDLNDIPLLVKNHLCLE